MSLPAACICIGDYVTIRHSNDEWLCAESLIAQDVLLSKRARANNFDDCVWEVHVQNQYNAIKEYESAVLTGQVQQDFVIESDRIIGKPANVAEQPKKSEEERTVEALNKLHRAALNEKLLNEKIMNLKIGKPVAYGDMVQLRHVKSNQFLTVNPFLLARNEKENLRIVVDARGDTTSALMFMPRFKHDREGQLIGPNTETLIRVHERPGEYLHSARRATSSSSQDVRREINCSLESSPFTICLYQKARKNPVKLVVAGELITLQDPESMTYLMVDSQAQYGDTLGVVLRQHTLFGGGSQLERNVGTNLLWILEKAELTQGGTIALDLDRFTLRDLNTNLFLKSTPDGLRAVKDRVAASVFECHGSSKGPLELVENSTIHLSCDGAWLCPMTAGAESVGDHCECVLKSERTTALSLLVSSSLRKSIGTDLFVGVQAAEFLNYFCEQLRLLETSQELANVIGAQIKPVFQTLEYLHGFYSEQKKVSVYDVDLLMEPPSNEVIAVRQDMAREQGVLDALIHLIEVAESDVLETTKTASNRQFMRESSTGKSQKVAPSSSSSPMTLPHHNATPPMEAMPQKDAGRVVSLGLEKKSVSFNKVKVASNDDEEEEEELDNFVDDEPARLKPILSAPKKQSGTFISLVNRVSSEAENRVRRVSNWISEITAKKTKPKAVIPILRQETTSLHDAPRSTELALLTPMGPTSLVSQLSDQFQRRASGDNDVVIARESDLEKFTLSQDLIQSCFRVLLDLLRDNHANQMRIADQFAVLLNHVRMQDLASQCVQEMLKDNLQILQTKIRQKEIDMFVRLIVEFEMSVTYLELIQSTCSCPMGVDNTQRMVTNALFGNGTKTEVTSRKSGRRGSNIGMSSFLREAGKVLPTMIFLQADFSSDELTQLSWNISESLYIPSATDLQAEIMGYCLISKGVPRVYATWKQDGEDSDDDENVFGMYYLFKSHDMVALEEICNPRRKRAQHTFKQPLSLMARYSQSEIEEKTAVPNESVVPLLPAPTRRNSVFENAAKKRRKSHLARTTVVVRKVKAAPKSQAPLTELEHKHRVKDFLIAELYLVADLCLDRNYVAIGLLESLFSYEMLISILLNKNVLNSMKAPVCRILRCMYVDREPQVEEFFPRLIRTSLSLDGESEGNFNDHHSGSPHTFCILQQLIADYIRDVLNSNKWDSLSVEMMDLLKALISFGFYDTIEQVGDILPPLVSALDDHRFNHKLGGQPSNSNMIQSDMSVSNLNLLNQKTWQQQISDKFSVVGKFCVLVLSYAFPEFFNHNGTKTWQKVWLETTERISYLLVVLAVVAVAVAILVVQFTTTFGNPNSYAIFDIFVTIFFAVEYFLRFYCYFHTHGSVGAFVKDPFNILDVTLVALDVCLWAIGVDVHAANAARAAKGIRAVKAIRFLRLLRIFRAARLLKKIFEVSSNVHRAISIRYASLSEKESKTLINILKVLSMILDRIQDQNLGDIIAAFAKWYQEERVGNMKSATAVHKAYINGEKSWEVDIPASFDHVLIDLLMYNDQKLVQEALNVLMMHKSRRQLLFSTTQRLQIISSTRMEIKFKEATMLLRDLKRLAEKFEIWCAVSTDGELKSASKTEEDMMNLAQILKLPNQDSTMGIKAEFLVDAEAQNLLLNMDALTTLMQVQETLFDGGREEMKEPIKRILRACNEVFVWFAKECPANQHSLFGHFSWFMERLDDGIHSSKVLRATLQGNRDLIKAAPRAYIAETAHRIFNSGHRPEYLDMFLGMTELSKVKNSRVHSVENEIARFLTAHDWNQKILLWCAPFNSPQYEERKRCMEPFLKQVETCDESELPPDLSFHLRLLRLLTTSNLGPKLQAIYPFEDVVHSAADASTILLVKLELSHLLSVMLESGVDGVDSSEEMWKYIESQAFAFESISATLKKILRDPTSNIRSRVTLGEWMSVSVAILTIFFEDFDYSEFCERFANPDDELTEFAFKQTSRSPVAIEETTKRTFNALKAILDTFSAQLGNELRDASKKALLAMSIHIGVNYDPNEAASAAARPASRGQKRMNMDTNKLETIRQDLYRKKFHEFADNVVRSHHDLERDTVALFESIPLQGDVVESDVRLELLIQKLTSHARSMLKKTSTTRSLEKKCTETTTWLLKIFRLILEKNLGLPCDQETLPQLHDIHENGLAEVYRVVFNNFGVTYLCLDLIAIGIEPSLTFTAARLLVFLLLKTSGNAMIQRSIHNYLYEKDSVLFFECIKDSLENLLNWTVQKSEAMEDMKSEDWKPEAISFPEGLIVLDLLQYMCEGNFLKIKDLFREQINNSRTASVMDCLAGCVDVLSRQESWLATVMVRLFLKTIAKLMQGPCPGNQEHFVMQTDLLLSLNRLVRHSRPAVEAFGQFWAVQMELLKETIVDVIETCLDDQQTSSVVFDRIATTLELNVFNVIFFPAVDVDSNELVDEIAEELVLSSVQEKYVVLLKRLGEVCSIPRLAAAKIEADVASVEVTVRGAAFTRYFHVPEIARHLKDDFSGEIDGISHEEKLHEFLKRVKYLYRDAQHRRNLEEYGIANVVALRSKLAWTMFWNACLMNILILVYFETIVPNGYYDETSNIEVASGLPTFSMPKAVANAITILNIAQIILAAATVAFLLIVRVPVNYFTFIESGHSVLESVLTAVTDPMTCWYSVYFSFAVLGVVENKLFLSVLLLDFLHLDRTCRHLLQAIYQPARQLLSTLVLIVICLNIFAGVIFYFYREDVNAPFAIDSLWASLKLGISYGIRGEYGVSKEMQKTLGGRMVLDMLYFFILLSILREIFFAVIIDTFDHLRELKYERDQETNNVCFICGSDRNEFDILDVSALGNKGFAYHRSVVHNTTNYMYYIMTLWERPAEYDNVVDMHVRRCLTSGDIAWIPMGRHYDHHSKRERGTSEAQTAIDGAVGDLDVEAHKMRELMAIQKQLAVLIEKEDAAILSSRQVTMSSVEAAEGDMQEMEELSRQIDQTTEVLKNISSKLDEIEGKNSS